MKPKRLDKLLEGSLYEQPEEPEAEDDEEDEEPEADSAAEKETDKKEKDIEDIDKDDIEADEEEYEDKDIAVAIKLNDNDNTSGDIKLVDYRKLASLNSIESILQLFEIDPQNVSPAYKDRIEITINSPIPDFREEEYKISLMDKIGEISVSRPDLKTTIEKSSKVPMGQAVQQSVGEPGTEQPQEETIDLSYLPELNRVFRQTIKNEFFDRTLQKR